MQQLRLEELEEIIENTSKITENTVSTTRTIRETVTTGLESGIKVKKTFNQIENALQENKKQIETVGNDLETLVETIDNINQYTLKVANQARELYEKTVNL